MSEEAEETGGEVGSEGNVNHDSKVPFISFPKNSWLSMVQTIIWQTAQVIIFSLVIIDVINTSYYLLLAWELFGMFFNSGAWAFVVFYRTGLASFATIMNYNQGKQSLAHYLNFLRCKIERLEHWRSDQWEFALNALSYLLMVIFTGTWIGIQGGANTAFQPLPLIPTAAQISGYVIQKFFCLMLVGMSVYCWREYFCAYESASIESGYFIKRLETKTHASQGGNGSKYNLGAVAKSSNRFFPSQ